jgi:Co/Zn/Cd efflux system component
MGTQVLAPRFAARAQLDAGRLRRTVLIVATFNLSYFFVEFAVALAAGSVALLADSVDFLEDTAINLLIFTALGWPLARRATLGGGHGHRSGLRGEVAR